MPRERKNAKKQNLDADGMPITKVKKRRTSTMTAGTGNNANSRPGSVGPGGPGAPGGNNELAPPLPSSGCGETIYASNPFDDFPSSNNGYGMGPGTPGPGQYMPGPPPPGQHPHSQHPMGPPMGPGGKPGMMGGKLYPSDVPRVSNPANPNAPPIYPCGICHREVHDNDQAILCESGCNFWYHRGCTGLSESAFAYLNEDVYAEWACDNCYKSKSIPLVKLKP